jgi:asparagine synthase (glutamine-hydrolysing)
MRGIVPNAVLDRRDKLGFPTPERDWLLALGPWVERLLSGETARTISALNFNRIGQEWSEIRQGIVKFDARVWRWVNLIMWAQKFSVAFEG